MTRVKVLTRTPETVMRRQLPNQAPFWGECEFLFNWDEPNYQWLVVYDDLPPVAGERRSRRTETLRCPRENTILVTTEPESIKSYFTKFTDQFGQVLTSQPDWALPHARRIYQQPGLRWFYGTSAESTLSFDQLAESKDGISRADKVGTVCSSKQQKHTLHDQRYRYTQALRALLPELEVFGRGVCEIDDKAESIDPFKYHLAIENHIAEHHWTEKLADPFLGEALPFYIGCPNASDYFPSESFVELDITNPERSAQIIRESIEGDEYTKRRPMILEAKKRVLEQHNLFAILANYIEHNSYPQPERVRQGVICSRRLCIDRNIISKLQHLCQKLKLRWLIKQKGLNHAR